MSEIVGVLRQVRDHWHEQGLYGDVEMGAAAELIEQQQAAIQRVRELHHFVVDEIETREGPEDVQHCSECGYIPTDDEPCPTLAALNTATWLRSLTDGGVA